jgi:hypothetical protein
MAGALASGLAPARLRPRPTEDRPVDPTLTGWLAPGLKWRLGLGPHAGLMMTRSPTRRNLRSPLRGAPMALRLLFGRATSPVRPAALITRQSAGPRGAARRQLSWEAAEPEAQWDSRGRLTPRAVDSDSRMKLSGRLHDSVCNWARTGRRVPMAPWRRTRPSMVRCPFAVAHWQVRRGGALLRTNKDDAASLRQLPLRVLKVKRVDLVEAPH